MSADEELNYWDGRRYVDLDDHEQARIRDLVKADRLGIAKNGEIFRRGKEPTMRSQAFALYTPPFKFVAGYIIDSKGNMMSDDGGAMDRIARRRDWGRIQYMENPEAIQEVVGNMIAEALNEFWSKASSNPLCAKEGCGHPQKDLIHNLATERGKAHGHAFVPSKESP